MLPAKKNSRSKGDEEEQTQPTYGVDAGIITYWIGNHSIINIKEDTLLFTDEEKNECLSFETWIS